MCMPVFVLWACAVFFMYGCVWKCCIVQMFGWPQGR